MKLYGYDIDGVCTKGVEKKMPYVVISGRTFAEYDQVCKDLAKDAPVYIRGVGKFGDAKHAGEHKANIINLLGVTEFYEDDPVQANIIKAKTKCKVVLHK